MILSCILLSPFLYLNFIYYLSNIMKSYTSGYNMNSIMYFYNSFQILLNLYMVYGLYHIIPSGIINIPYSNTIEYFVHIHYISKYIDYLDTFFIILRKKEKQLSFLHIYHHSTIGIIWGFLLYKGHGNGTAAFGCLINSLIHVIMYSHYLITSLGIYNPYKKYITQLQLLQFFICLLHSIIVIGIEKIVPVEYAYIQVGYQIQMLLLFSHFYNKNYSFIKIKS